MEPILKPNVSLSLRALSVNDSVTFSLNDVGESSVRSLCTRLSSTLGYRFSVERQYPSLIVTRTL